MIDLKERMTDENFLQGYNEGEAEGYFRGLTSSEGHELGFAEGYKAAMLDQSEMVKNAARYAFLRERPDGGFTGAWSKYTAEQIDIEVDRFMQYPYHT